MGSLFSFAHSDLNKCPVSRKISLSSKEEAQKMAKSLRKKRGSKTKPYKCPHCGAWHIGHNRPPERRRDKIGTTDK